VRARPSSASIDDASTVEDEVRAWQYPVPKGAVPSLNPFNSEMEFGEIFRIFSELLQPQYMCWELMMSDIIAQDRHVSVSIGGRI
jgi:hypothetical protein